MQGTNVARNGFQAFVDRARRYPLLSAEEERELALRWRDEGDSEAAQKLINSHLRLVVTIARRFMGYGLPLDDVASQGMVGLMQALHRFDPDQNARFSTYAMWWIRAAIQEYVMHQWSSVKLGTTAAQKKLFFNLKRLKNELGDRPDSGLQPEDVRQIAETLGVTEGEVLAMNDRMAGHDQSLNAPLSGESDTEWQDWLTDEESTPEAEFGEQEELTYRRRLVADAMGVLDDRQRHILEARHMREPAVTLESLAQRYGISRERVRQVEEQALKKLRKRVSTLTRQGEDLRPAA
jgi:RNA polymerase sigma-32 factor